MNDTKLSAFEVWRSRAYLFAVGVKRHVTLGNRVALFEGDRVLLVRQTYLPGWHMPGGGVEVGETAELSAARELFEETGYRPVGRMALHGLFLKSDATTNRDHIAVFICRQAEKAGEFAVSREIAEMGWFAVAALPDSITPPTRRRIAEIMSGATPDSMW